MLTDVVAALRYPHDNDSAELEMRVSKVSSLLNVYAALFTVCMVFSSIGSAQDRSPQVNIDSGTVEGVLNSAGARVFKGIPYAASPVGDLRWREPQPTKPWAGARKTTDFGDRCQQGPFPAYHPIGGSGMSENCLFLNVWSAPDSVRRPPSSLGLDTRRRSRLWI